MSARAVIGYRVFRRFLDGSIAATSTYDGLDRHEVSKRGDLTIWSFDKPTIRVTIADGFWTAIEPIQAEPIEDISVGRITTGVLSGVPVLSGVILTTNVEEPAGLDPSCDCGCEDGPAEDSVSLAEKAVDLARNKADQVAMESAHANQAAADDVSEAMAALILAKRDAA